MAKPKMIDRDLGGAPEKRLPVDIMMSDLHSFEREKVAGLLEEALELKSRLDEKVPDEMYDPKFHVQRRYDEVRAELAEIQAAEGMEDGLRYNNILFTTTLAQGRRTLNKELLVQNLLAEGMKAEKVMRVVEGSMKEGSETWRKTIKLLDDK